MQYTSLVYVTSYRIPLFWCITFVKFITILKILMSSLIKHKTLTSEDCKILAFVLYVSSKLTAHFLVHHVSRTRYLANYATANCSSFWYISIFNMYHTFQRIGWSLFRWSEIISDHFMKKYDKTRDRDWILDPIFRQGSRSNIFLNARSRSDRRSYFLAKIEIGS